ILPVGDDSIATIAATGPVTLDTPGDVGPGNHSIVFDATQTPSSVDVGSTSMPTNVYLAGLGDLTLGTVRTNGNAAIAVSAAGALSAAGPISGGDVSLSAPALTVTAAASVTAGNTLSVSADTLTLLGTLSAGSSGIVTVKPLTATRNIDLGG